MLIYLRKETIELTDPKASGGNTIGVRMGTEGLDLNGFFFLCKTMHECHSLIKITLIAKQLKNGFYTFYIYLKKI